MKNNLQLAKNARYEWNPAFRSMLARKTDIKTIVKALHEIEDTYGEINPQLLLEASKSKKSVFHNYFEWDNDRAADAWRITQARALLGAVQVKVVKEGKPVQMRAYQITKSAGAKLGQSSYSKFDAVPENNILYVQRDIMGKLVAIQHKAEANDLDEILPLVEKAIRILQKKVEVIDITSSK